MKQKEKDELVAQLRDLHDALKDAVSEANESIAGIIECLQNGPLKDYNDLVTSVTEKVAEYAVELQDKYDDKSEKWQESDKGSEFEQLISELEGYTPEEIEIETPDEIEIEECSTAADDLDNLVVTPGQ